MSLSRNIVELARGVVEVCRRPGTAGVGMSQISLALNGLPRVQMIERRTAGVFTNARLQGCSWGLYDQRFRKAVMLEPGAPFALAREFDELTSTPIVEALHLGATVVDIRAITCLSMSKGALQAYATLDEFAMAECRSEIGQADEAALGACLRHHGVHLSTTDQSGGDRLEAISWSGGDLYWPNTDGSHHFAAARYIAGKLGVKVPIRAPVVAHSIVDATVRDLHRRFSGWVLPDLEATWDVVHMMHEFGAHVGIANMPRPYDALLLLLPSDTAVTSTVAGLIEASGATSFQLFTDRWLHLQIQAHGEMPELFGN